MRLYATMAELRSRNGDRTAQKAKTIYHLPIMLATPWSTHKWFCQ